MAEDITEIKRRIEEHERLYTEQHPKWRSNLKRRLTREFGDQTKNIYVHPEIFRSLRGFNCDFHKYKPKNIKDVYQVWTIPNMKNPKYHRNMLVNGKIARAIRALIGCDSQTFSYLDIVLAYFDDGMVIQGLKVPFGRMSTSEKQICKALIESKSHKLSLSFLEKVTGNHFYDEKKKRDDHFRGRIGRINKHVENILHKDRFLVISNQNIEIKEDYLVQEVTPKATETVSL